MSSLIRTNSGFAGVPKIKLNNSKTYLMRENLLQLCQKQTIENSSMIMQKVGTPNSNSMRPSSKQSGGNSNTAAPAAFLTPKEGRINTGKDSPQYNPKLFNETKSSVFSDYYNQQQQQQQQQLLQQSQMNKLPSINKSNLNRYSSKEELNNNKDNAMNNNSSSGVNSPIIKSIRQKTNTFSSEFSNCDMNSNASTQDNLDKVKGKSTFFRLKAQSPSMQPISKAQGDSSDISINNNANIMNHPQSHLGVLSNNNENERFQQYYSTNQSPPNTEQTAFLFKQQQQQMNIKTIYEEQKKQMQRVEDIISPFPPKSSHRKKPLQRMSLNVNSTSDINFLNNSVNILQEKIGGEKILNKFIWDLIYAMKKNEFFDILLEEYHNQLPLVHSKIQSLLMNIFIDNTNAIANSVQEFLYFFTSINDTNIFQMKIFFIDFLTTKSSINNSFIDKSLAYKIIEYIEVFRPQLTGNEELINLYGISLYNLCDNIIENFITSEFFKKYELEKINSFSKVLIDLLFNKISSQNLITSFESTFSVVITQSHLNLLKDILKKSLSELKEYNSIFRKNISYQLKKIQWLLPNSPTNTNYIDVVNNCTDLFTIMSKVIVQIDQYYLLNHETFNSFLKIFYSKYNIYNMVDINQVFKQKHPEKSRENIEILVSLLKQTLINQKVSVELAKKIEIFTLSIFE